MVNELELKKVEEEQQLISSYEDYNKLLPQQRNVVDNYMKNIDVMDNANIMKYGADSQNRIANFSENVLKSTMTKDSGEAGELLMDLSNHLKGFDKNLNEKGGFLGLFNNAKKKMNMLKTKYTSIEKVIQDVEKKLEGHRNVMLNDIKIFDNMYQENWEHYKEVCLYILAGEQKLQELKNVELPRLQKIAQESGDQIDVQKANDLQSAITRFEKRLYDLKITKTIAIQTAPQIRLIQNNDATLADKIQSSIFTALPIWKGQFVIALGLENAKQALEAQQTITDLTNEMLKKNSEMLKMGTIEIAEESEKSVVNIETLVEVNKNLIETIDSVVEIHRQGAQDRKAGEQELMRLENELKDRLMKSEE